MTENNEYDRPPRDEKQQKFIKYLEDTGRKQKRTLQDSPSDYSPSKDIVSSRSIPQSQRINSYRASSAQKSFERESVLVPQPRHSLSARKVLDIPKTPDTHQVKMRKTVGWEDLQEKEPKEEEYIVPSYRTSRNQITPSREQRIDERPSLRDYLKTDFAEDEEVEIKPAALSQTKDLKEEIGQLDDEIYEIQKLIRDELEN